LFVFHLEFAEPVAARFRYHHFSRFQADRQIGHFGLRRLMVRYLADDGRAARMQFGLEAQIQRTIAGMI